MYAWYSASRGASASNWDKRDRQWAADTVGGTTQLHIQLWEPSYTQMRITSPHSEPLRIPVYNLMGSGRVQSAFCGNSYKGPLIPFLNLSLNYRDFKSPTHQELSERETQVTNASHPSRREVTFSASWVGGKRPHWSTPFRASAPAGGSGTCRRGKRLCCMLTDQKTRHQKYF